MQLAEDSAAGIPPADLKVRAAGSAVDSFSLLVSCRGVISSVRGRYMTLTLLLQIILLGDSAAGKSKLLVRFLEDQYNPRQR